MRKAIIKTDLGKESNKVTVYFDLVHDKILALYAPNTDGAPLQEGDSMYSVEYYKPNDRVRILRTTCTPGHVLRYDSFWCTPPRDIAGGEYVKALYKGMEISIEPMTESLFRDLRSK